MYYGKFCVQSCSYDEDETDESKINYVVLQDDGSRLCQTGCDSGKVKYVDTSLGICYCQDECKIEDSDSYYDADNTFCDKKCQGGYLYVNVEYYETEQSQTSFQCVNSCSGDYPYINTTYVNGVQQCYDICPSLTYDNSTKQCVTSCSGYYYVETKQGKSVYQCVEECQSTDFVYELECQTTCPESAPYMVGGDDRNCYVSCPTGYVNPYCENETDCQTETSKTCIPVSDSVFFITNSKNARWALPSTVDSSCAQAGSLTNIYYVQSVVGISDADLADYIYQYQSDDSSVSQHCYSSCSPEQYAYENNTYYCQVCQAFSKASEEFEGYY